MKNKKLSNSGGCLSFILSRNSHGNSALRLSGAILRSDIKCCIIALEDKREKVAVKL